MIRIRKVGYMLRTADYFYGEGSQRDAHESPGTWVGHATATLGWQPGDPVPKSDFIQALRGMDANGFPFVRRFGARRIPAHDLVVAAPKSVSIATQCLDPHIAAPIAAANTDAATVAFDFLECLATGRQRDYPYTVPTAALTAVRFDHRDSRDQVPHTHVHFIILNFTSRDGSGFQSALGERPIYRALEPADRVYKAALRDKIESLGYPMRMTSNGPELAAIPRKLILDFSDGKHRIDKAERIAPPPADAPLDRGQWRQVLNDRTRPDKVPLDKRPLLYGLLRPEVRNRIQIDLRASQDASRLADSRTLTDPPLESRVLLKFQDGFGLDPHPARISTATPNGQNVKQSQTAKTSTLARFAVELMDRVRNLRPGPLIRALRRFVLDPSAGRIPRPVAARPNPLSADEMLRRRRRLEHARRLRESRKRRAQSSGPEVPLPSPLSAHAHRNESAKPSLNL